MDLQATLIEAVLPLCIVRFDKLNRSRRAIQPVTMQKCVSVSAGMTPINLSDFGDWREIYSEPRDAARDNSASKWAPQVPASSMRVLTNRRIILNVGLLLCGDGRWDLGPM